MEEKKELLSSVLDYLTNTDEEEEVGTKVKKALKEDVEEQAVDIALFKALCLAMQQVVSMNATLSVTLDNPSSADVEDQVMDLMKEYEEGEEPEEPEDTPPMPQAGFKIL